MVREASSLFGVGLVVVAFVLLAKVALWYFSCFILASMVVPFLILIVENKI